MLKEKYNEPGRYRMVYVADTEGLTEEVKRTFLQNKAEIETCPYGRNRRRTKEPLDEGERGE